MREPHSNNSFGERRKAPGGREGGTGVAMVVGDESGRERKEEREWVSCMYTAASATQITTKGAASVQEFPQRLASSIAKHAVCVCRKQEEGRTG